MQPVLIYQNKTKLFWLLFASIVLTMASAAIVTGAIPGEISTYKLFMCWVGLILFSLCSMVFVFQLLNHEPAIIIDEQGITYNVSVGKLGLIRWNIIKRVFIYNQVVRGVTYKHIGIEVDNIEQLMTGLPSFRRFFLNLNCMFGLPPLLISTTSLDLHAEQILAIVHQFHPEYVR
jgi:hypothetical protein